jgi:acetyl-CoA carboxylase biotin carboxyl carrier protein
MDIDRIKSVIDLMCEHELNEFAIEDKDFKLSLKRGGAATMMAAPMMAAPQMAAPAGGPAAAAAPAAPAEDHLTPIPSPLVGTFYRAGRRMPIRLWRWAAG